jgi:hypothetical protein
MDGTVSLYSIATTLNELACMTRELARARITGADIGMGLCQIEAGAGEIELHWGGVAEAFCPEPLPYDPSVALPHPRIAPGSHQGPRSPLWMKK